MKPIPKLALYLVPAILFCSCDDTTPILKADFERDIIGGQPDVTLPGNPTGDTIEFNDVARPRFTIVRTPGDASHKSLRLTKVPLASYPPSHQTWLAFKAAPTNLVRPITFTFNGEYDELQRLRSFQVNIDISDGNDMLLARLQIKNGTRHDQFVLYRIDNYNAESPPVRLGEVAARHTIWITVNLSNTANPHWGVYVHNNGINNLPDFNANNLPLFRIDPNTPPHPLKYANPSRPSISFAHGGGDYTSFCAEDQCRYFIHDIEIYKQ